MKFKKDDEILDYLMTSEFIEEDLNPEEIRELLFKFRHFYRLSHSKQRSLQYQIDELNDKLDLITSKVEILEKKLEYRDSQYKDLKSKKLSWKERFKGKIIT